MINPTENSDYLQEYREIIYTAYSCKNFYQGMLISKFVFDEGCVPLNPFNNFGYFLYELVERNKVREGNNNLLKRCDQVWVFGEISDGVLSEIKTFKPLSKPIRFFDISHLPNKIIKIPKEKVKFEEGVEYGIHYL